MNKNFSITSAILFVFLCLISKLLCDTANIHSFHKILVIAAITIVVYFSALKILCKPDTVKNIKPQSKIDFIFVSIFFILLFIPMSHINKNIYTDNEERNLAPYPKLFSENLQINNNFGKDFDEWFDDRFNLRMKLIYFNRFVQFYVNKHYVKYAEDQVADKYRNILFTKWEMNEVEQEELIKNFNTLKKFNKYCNNKHIKLYTLIVPEKEGIYRPDTILKPDNTNLEYVINLCPKKYIKILYPLNELRAGAKNNYMYYKTDHHWTEDGAFIAYKALMKDIKSDFPDVNPLDYNDFDITDTKYVNADWENTDKIGFTCKYFSLPNSLCKRFLDANYRHFTYHNANALTQEVIDEPYIKQKDFYYPDGADYRVVIIGTSMGEQLTKFIPYNFKHTRRIRINNVLNVKKDDEFRILANNKEQIFDYHPDIIILCIAHYNAEHLTDIFR